MRRNDPNAIFHCPYCLGNQHPENNVLIFCHVCKGSGKVSYATRERWRASLPVHLTDKTNDDSDTYF